MKQVPRSSWRFLSSSWYRTWEPGTTWRPMGSNLRRGRGRSRRRGRRGSCQLKSASETSGSNRTRRWLTACPRPPWSWWSRCWTKVRLRLPFSQLKSKRKFICYHPDDIMSSTRVETKGILGCFPPKLLVRKGMTVHNSLNTRWGVPVLCTCLPPPGPPPPW